MKDNESVKAGDILVCISNEGYWSLGDKRMIYGLTEKSINMCGSTTGWYQRSGFRWGNYEHRPCEVVPEEVIRFAEQTEKIRENNKIILEKRKEFLDNRNKRTLKDK